MNRYICDFCGRALELGLKAVFVWNDEFSGKKLEVKQYCCECANDIKEFITPYTFLSAMKTVDDEQEEIEAEVEETTITEVATYDVEEDVDEAEEEEETED